jgi:F0F1-type ATP synthase membrane subunit b/b'
MFFCTRICRVPSAQENTGLVMEILRSLGVNETLWIQLACFLVSYAAFSQLILKPYLAAMKEREKRTVGNENLATRLLEEAEGLTAQYEQKARAINNEMKAAYDMSRQKATKQAESVMAGARNEATQLLDAARGKITTEIQSARQTLSSEIPAIGAVIATKLSGKDMTV